MHRKYHGRPSETAAKPAKKAAPAKKTEEAPAAKKEAAASRERSLQNRKNTVVSERILAAAGISGSGVLLNVLTIRM